MTVLGGLEEVAELSALISSFLGIIYCHCGVSQHGVLAIGLGTVGPKACVCAFDNNKRD